MAEKKLAVVGHPVGHSRSPAMQTAALRALGLDSEWSYEAIEISPMEFAPRMSSLFAKGYVGVNVTVPHKRAALEFADSASSAASEIGAANMLTFKDRRIAAENTDAPAMLAALPHSPTGRRALVLGAGGTARAAIWGLVEEGTKVDVWNRTPERAEALADEFGVEAVSEPRAAVYALIVNCTTVGMEGAAGSLADLPLGSGAPHAGQTVVDFVYGEGETELAGTARSAGADVVDGLELLVRQGAISFRIWTGQEPPLAVMREAARSG
jgi:shikimate dehydrogenase